MRGEGSLSNGGNDRVFTNHRGAIIMVKVTAGIQTRLCPLTTHRLKPDGCSVTAGKRRCAVSVLPMAWNDTQAKHCANTWLPVFLRQ